MLKTNLPHHNHIYALILKLKKTATFHSHTFSPAARVKKEKQQRENQ